MWSIFKTKKRRLEDILQGFRKNIKKSLHFFIFLFFYIFAPKGVWASELAHSVGGSASLVSDVFN